MLEDVVDTTLCVHDINTLDLHIPTTNVSQGSVVDGAVLGEVDLLASEHGIALLLNTSLLSKLDEKVEGLICEEVLGEVEEDLGADTARVEGAGESVETLRVRSKGFLENEGLANAVAVRLEVRPGGESVCGGHFVDVRIKKRYIEGKRGEKKKKKRGNEVVLYFASGQDLIPKLFHEWRGKEQSTGGVGASSHQMEASSQVKSSVDAVMIRSIFSVLL